MNYWIFNTKNQKANNITLTGREIYVTRMRDQFWGLGERTPNRNAINPGDHIIFYLGNPDKVFAGTATAATPSYQLSPQEQEKMSHDSPVYNTEYGLKLADIVTWEVPKPIPALVDQLNFIENKEFWGSYFQGGVRGIYEEDFTKIVAFDYSPTEIVIPPVPVATPQQFALEAHLEEFMFSNWHKIHWGGRSLRLYEAADMIGRQFPAGKWSIDFLAVDNKTNDLVVIELKRGQTSDATVGQVLRYMGWVRENLAINDQKVHGIIICHEIDEDMRYAAEQIPNLTLLTYEVKFELKPFR